MMVKWLIMVNKSRWTIQLQQGNHRINSSIVSWIKASMGVVRQCRTCLCECRTSMPTDLGVSSWHWPKPARNCSIFWDIWSHRSLEKSQHHSLIFCRSWMILIHWLSVTTLIHIDLFDSLLSQRGVPSSDSTCRARRSVVNVYQPQMSFRTSDVQSQERAVWHNSGAVENDMRPCFS